VRGTRATTYIYAGDRWQDPDLGSSKYVWLPLVLRGAAQLSLDYYPEWQLDPVSGEWRVDDGFLPQTDWKLVRADSEETSAENGRASNAFDGSASTFWHTQYTGSTPAPPHEIVIDLGASYMLESLRYLPRQDAVDHGIVSAYEFYLSDAADGWEQPVATGTFAADRAAKLVRFSARAGRYVRFVAMQEINGREWTSIAEIDLMGVKQ
jgi:F5/8 type C domain